MMRLMTLASLCAFAVFASGCQTTDPSESAAAKAVASTGSVLQLTAADNGKSVSLQAGESLSVALQGNASTGYSWALANSDASVLAQSGRPVVGSEAVAAGIVGAPELTTWTFVARKAGQSTLNFEYRRPWEKDSAAAQAFGVKVSVTE